MNSNSRTRKGPAVSFALTQPLAQNKSMSVGEIESAVERLPSDQLAAFTKWFEDFVADAWDRKFEEDVVAGKLDHLAKQADEDFEAGRCTPL